MDADRSGGPEQPGAAASDRDPHPGGGDLRLLQSRGHHGDDDVHSERIARPQRPGDEDGLSAEQSHRVVPLVGVGPPSDRRGHPLRVHQQHGGRDRLHAGGDPPRQPLPIQSVEDPLTALLHGDHRRHHDAHRNLHQPAGLLPRRERGLRSVLGVRVHVPRRDPVRGRTGLQHPGATEVPALPQHPVEPDPQVPPERVPDRATYPHGLEAGRPDGTRGAGQRAPPSHRARDPARRPEDRARHPQHPHQGRRHPHPAGRDGGHSLLQGTLRSAPAHRRQARRQRPERREHDSGRSPAVADLHSRRFKPQGAGFPAKLRMLRARTRRTGASIRRKLARIPLKHWDTLLVFGPKSRVEALYQREDFLPLGEFNLRFRCRASGGFPRS